MITNFYSSTTSLLPANKVVNLPRNELVSIIEIYSITWEHDADYKYYKHGSLARMVIGEQQVQGVDYAYTLQGWLKGVNSSAPSNYDMGQDGYSSKFARNAYGFALNYYNGDYAPIKNNEKPFAAPSGSNFKPLYNGNIASMSVYLPKLGTSMLYNYNYDQLNRLTAMQPYTGLDTINNAWNPVAINSYKERVSYDANGNILKYNRYGNTGIIMDSLNYTYTNNTNKLTRITDAVAANTFSGDIDNQAANNYLYDNLGNLTKDVKEKIDSIYWNIYGRITKITRQDTTITFTYDAAGNRISKTVAKPTSTITTWYVRDASGNVMSVYDKSAASDLTQNESHLYGSSRLGIYKPAINVEHPLMRQEFAITGIGNGYVVNFERGRKFFELVDHRGNSMAVITDKKLGINTDADAYLNYFTPDVVSNVDYAPFGAQLMGRTYSSTTGKYRYGFNGKELDNETYGQGNEYDYGFRIYNPRIGRFLSIDPLTQKYPWYTPYQFAGNMPIAFIDLDGAEEVEPTIHYNPITNGGWATYPKLSKSNWYDYDRSCACNSFSTAAQYNTEHLNSVVYQPINQVHKYYVWATREIDKLKANLKFFHAARDVTAFWGVGGAYGMPEFVTRLSDEGRKSLHDVNAKLLQENMPVIREILEKGKSSLFNDKTGIVWDLAYVNREQNFLSDVINKNPLSESDRQAINGNFERFEKIHPEYTLAKALVGVNKLDYLPQKQREAIGRSLVFILHMEDPGFEGSEDYKRGIEFLRKEYGNKNVDEFLKKYNENRNKIKTLKKIKDE